MGWLVVSYVWVLVHRSEDIEYLLLIQVDTMEERRRHTCRLVTLRSSSNASRARSDDAAPPGFPNMVKKDHGALVLNTLSSTSVKSQ